MTDRQKAKIPLKIYIKITTKGCVRSGDLMAVMGSSGAGKSTMMNILTRRNIQGLKIDGSITVNGKEIKDCLSFLILENFSVNHAELILNLDPWILADVNLRQIDLVKNETMIDWLIRNNCLIRNYSLIVFVNWVSTPNLFLA